MPAETSEGTLEMRDQDVNSRNRSAARALVTTAVVLVVTVPAFAAGRVSYDLTLDVPAALGGVDFTPNEIVHGDDLSYELEAVFPSLFEPAAMQRRPNGRWLFAPGHPVDLDGATYDSGDILEYDGVSYTLVLDGSTAGIPAYARIDALLLDESGELVLSFDVPVNLGGSEYEPSDLVLHSGGAFAPYWDAGAAGVPLSSNVVGASIDGTGSIVMSFDAPTTLGSSDYLPGELVRYDSSIFDSLLKDPAWPAYARIHALNMGPWVGTVGLLTLNKAAGGDLSLGWGSSCNASDTDYEIYEGALGSFDTHLPINCTTGGATSDTVTPSPGDRYYLVVPRNVVHEGSYGTSSGSVERPASSSACRPQAVGACQP